MKYELSDNEKIIYNLPVNIYLAFTIAQNKITGRITDEKTGEAITGATVYIPELKTGTFADKNGEYKIENLPQTNVIIQVSFLGYKSVL